MDSFSFLSLFLCLFISYEWIILKPLAATAATVATRIKNIIQLSNAIEENKKKNKEYKNCYCKGWEGILLRIAAPFSPQNKEYFIGIAAT